MNAVGELVINRTRMLGRLKELSKLVEVLAFSKTRLSGKVAEFQEKHEFNRISAYLAPGSMPPQMDTFRLPLRGLSSGKASSASSLSGFSELEMDRYDDFNILIEVAHRNIRGRQRSSGAARVVPLARGCGHR